jgi:hypothetical protein
LQTVNDIVVVNFNSGTAAASDLKVSLVVDNSIVAAYNAANNENYVVFKPTLYTIPSLTLTIPKGGRLAQVAINIPSTVPLSLDSSYAIGLRIASNDGGFQIAENLKNLLVVFNLKNKFDGIYRLKGYHNRDNPNYTIPYDVDIHMVTSGPNSVVFYYPNPGPNDYAHPINGSTGSYYGSFAPNIGFAATTNAAGHYPALTCTEYFAGTLPMNIIPTSNSRYEPATKKMYINFRYNNNDLRQFFDTLTYKGPRP